MCKSIRHHAAEAKSVRFAGFCSHRDGRARGICAQPAPLDACWNDTPADRTRTTPLGRLDLGLRHAAFSGLTINVTGTIQSRHCALIAGLAPSPCGHVDDERAEHAAGESAQGSSAAG